MILIVTPLHLVYICMYVYVLLMHISVKVYTYTPLRRDFHRYWHVTQVQMVVHTIDLHLSTAN